MKLYRFKLLVPACVILVALSCGKRPPDQPERYDSPPAEDTAYDSAQWQGPPDGPHRALVLLPKSHVDTLTLADTTHRHSVDTTATDYIFWSSDSLSNRRTITTVTARRDSTKPIPIPESVSGVPFGPFSLWTTSYSQPNANPAPFTMSQNSDSPSGIITRITAAKGLGQGLVLMMTGGSHSNYLTNGAFDLVKWKARMDLYNTAAIKTAVAAGVANGTVLGADVMDEPQAADWNGSVNKLMLDQMANYVKAIFPTVPVGVSYRIIDYRATERFHVIDYVATQYIAYYGPVTTWRDKALAAALLNGVKVMFSLNVLNGGAGFNMTSCPVPATGGPGLNTGRCAMSPTQIRQSGAALGKAGCALLLWRWDAVYMAKAENAQAFREVADSLRRLPRQSCRRT
jgi:hypothetical protein